MKSGSTVYFGLQLKSKFYSNLYDKAVTGCVDIPKYRTGDIAGIDGVEFRLTGIAEILKVYKNREAFPLLFLP